MWSFVFSIKAASGGVQLIELCDVALERCEIEIICSINWRSSFVGKRSAH
jgi:hypothetical protein